MAVSTLSEQPGTSTGFKNIRWLMIGMIFMLTVINYIDRMIMAAVLERVRHDLGLSNLLAGSLATVFMVGYFVTSPIFSRLAKRLPRVWLIAVGVLVWSLATVGTGLVRGIAPLIVMRVLVGVGEASYATLAPTIIDDLAPPERRSRWLAVFYVATPLGSVGEQRHRDALMPPQQHGPGHRVRSEPLLDAVQRDVDRVGVRTVQRQRELDRPIVAQVAVRDADQRDAAFADHGLGLRQEAPRRGQQRLGARGRLVERA